MNAFLGQVQAFGFNFGPKGWMQCNGQLLAISENQPLYALLGTTYGGDGRVTFALPKLNPIGGSQGPNYFICVTGGEFPPRS
jgi:microcystin-dependent protein